MPFRTLLLFALIIYPKSSSGFAILTHEAVIDVSWEKSILPVLRKRFPNSSDSDYIKAKAYTYGGAIMPDMGFFPFGSIFFTNLVHYVRSGDFTQSLLDESQDLNQYAFALGALAHYNADNYGHPLGVNISVGIVYPKDRRKYGDNITYANDPIDHRRMELAFDVLQIARGNYLKENYTGFIGFELSKSLLERAFLKTYGIELGSIFGNLDLSIASFRFSVQNLLAPITKAAWVNKKDEIQKLNPEMTDQKFQFTKNRKEYKKAWGKTPLLVSLISGVIRVMPKVIGSSRVLRFRLPTPEAEQQFNDCFDSVIQHYDESLTQLKNEKLKLSNRDYDTGLASVRCEYSLADATYSQLLKRLKHDRFAHVNIGLKENILQFYCIPMTADTSNIGALYKTFAKEKKACIQSKVAKR
ncbi:MAG TPA: zinc dependent phospholipase C family protein [Chitinophagales bacterium]|nr:zinc dependent phospholipase C family protein [Chitinophagales bacterium]